MVSSVGPNGPGTTNYLYSNSQTQQTDDGSSDSVLGSINRTTNSAVDTYKGLQSQSAGSHSTASSGGGGIGGFFSGLMHGASNMVSTLMTPKGLLMAGAAAVACMVCPPVGVALVAAGAVSGGIQVAKGVASGNTEQIGEGVFTLGMSAVGARGVGGALKGKDGATYTAAGGRASEAAATSEKAVTALKAAEKEAATAETAAKTASADAKVAAEAKATEAKATLTKAQADHDAAIAAQSKAQARVDSKLPEGAPKTAADAKTAVKDAKSALDEARANGLDTRAAEAKYAEALSNEAKLAQAGKGQLGKTWDSITDIFHMGKGGKLTGPDGKTITLYNRGTAAPKPAATGDAPGVASASADEATGLATANKAADAKSAESAKQSWAEWGKGFLKPTTKDGKVITTGFEGFKNHIKSQPGQTVLNGYFANQAVDTVM